VLGKTLNHYRILEKIGQGGMGEVYLAEDSRLDRKVAVKILPEHLSERAELRERFEREARAVSSLNHPHICTLHDIGEQDGIHFLVMEHLEGESLAERLEKGALSLEQTLQYAIQIADALDKAHRQGVVHRDLKPGNIMLVKSGAKLLDFGLAKLRATEATEGNLSALPTKASNLTVEGTILGTLQYMAPEQLEGKDTDSRTDIFAFGAVVYEMATGKKAFEGSSQASLIAAIMGQEPRPMAELQPMTPALLNQVVKKCLAKEPDERWQSASDLITGLKWVTEVGTPVDSLSPVTAAAAWKRAIPWGIAATALILAGVAVWSFRDPLPRSVTRLDITPSRTQPLVNDSGSEVAISPDGRWIAYVVESEGMRKLYRRSMDDFTAMEIPGTEGAGTNPFFSPDGKFLAFFADGSLKKVPLTGGIVTTLTDAVPSEQIGSGDWGFGDTIVFTAGADRMNLRRISGVGGEYEILTMPDPQKGESQYRDPEILPDGTAVLFTVWSRDGFHTAALSLETGDQKIIIEEGRSPHYMATGHLLYELPGTGTLMIVPFDLDELEVRGDPVPVLQGVRYTRVSGADFTISKEGTLAYVSGRLASRSLVWVDHEGKSTPLMERPVSLEQPRVSVDGQRVAVGSDYDIFIFNLSREVLTPLTGEWWNHAQAWSPDGNRVAFSSTKDGGEPNIFWASPDGGEEWERLTSSPNEQYPGSFSPDGKVLIFTEVNPSTGRDIWSLPMEGDGSPQSFLSTAAQEWEPRFAPNGQLVAYTSDESGQNEVYVRPYPAGPGEWKISNQGGRDPLWAPDGETLFYRNGPKMMAVAVETEPAFTPGRPRLLFDEGGYTLHPPGFTNHDISPDGRQFLMIKQETASEQTQIRVILNWTEELKQLAPTDN